MKTGVRQGCILSPKIFLMVIDWVMRKTTQDNNTGIQWTFTKQLEDLDFADDISLLYHRQQHAQTKLSKLAEEAEKTGLKINKKKTENILETDHFTYLGSIVSKDAGADDDIRSRINKARHAFNSLRPIWNSRALSLRSKTRIFNTNVKAVLLYGSETWRVTNTINNKLQTFTNRCLRHILRIRWPERISNSSLWERTNQNATSQDTKKRKWGWIGHTLRKPADTIARQALDWNPQGKRKVGRPKQTWRRSVESEAKAAETTWGTN
ncbi:hypothetical protein C0Q70_20154 [Pomacea canaliculata]|uniref:Reverse transcriptase domain-containing protein n=1 Tax=Pomacea canaliculata TaxID=400727 RepID=A0A2T7NER3_POMCA|nr:hypothetical protein C0Q70_20154 [Pomacea canaliculata]